MAEIGKMADEFFGKTADKWFGKILADVNKKINAFVAFFFFLLAVGMFIGVTVVQNYPEQAMLAVGLTAVAGLIAYINRALAILVFVIMIALIFFL